ncbi:MAG: hypothetical protein ACOYXC_21765 [Candidatus Rifleibacteriota bacterium]
MAKGIFGIFQEALEEEKKYCYLATVGFEKFLSLNILPAARIHFLCKKMPQNIQAEKREKTYLEIFWKKSQN